ncbi:hypothetical protein JCM11251_001830 [Rhodosporidiobolus azoricus]
MSRRDAAYQMFLTAGGFLLFVSLFALWHGASSGSGGLREAVTSRWEGGKAYLFRTSASSNEATLSHYSWHQCIGGAEWGNEGRPFAGRGIHTRRCHFKNVCVRLLPLDASVGLKWDTDTNTTIELTYYKNPLLVGGTKIWSTTQGGDEESWLMTDRDHNLTTKTVFEEVPKELKKVETPTVLMGSFWPHNFGHAIGDDLFPAFRLLRQFNLLRPDNYYAFHQSCDFRGGEIGCKNAEAVTSALTTRPYQKLGGELFPNTEEAVCFADLVMGPNALTMRVADERAWPDMITRMKENFGLRPLKSPLKKHKVVVIEKHGRRTWLNYEEVREHIEETYGVETLLVNPAELTIEEQIRLLDQTTVLVTPPGGVSFSSPFLHEGAAAIYVEYWDTTHERSFPMDQEVYTWNPSLHALFYPLARADLSLNRTALDPVTLSHFVNDEMGLWQGYSNVRINLDRLDVYLRDAFVHTSRSIGVGLPPGLR